MAANIAATGAARSASSATKMLSAKTAVATKMNLAIGHKARAGLIYDMHSKLYPHLYDDNCKPVAPLTSSRLKKYKPNGVARKSPLFYEGKDAFKKAYSDEKLQAAEKHIMKLQVYPTKPTIHKTCPDPVAVVTAAQIALHDPSGQRTRLFSRTNAERACVGDVLLVRQRTGEPFAGVCINIRRRGVDTAILLRGQLTRVGVEMWFKVYSPLVEGIEVVQRAAKRARRARLTFMRLPKHDRGSVENVVRVYLRQKAALGTAEGKKKGVGGVQGVLAGKKGNKRGKQRR